MSKVKETDTVRVHYTGKLENGQIFDSSLERDPLEVTLGQGSLIPGFEKELIDMKENQKKTITIPKEEAYGEVREELFQEIKKEELPPNIEPEVGMGLVATNEDGSERQLRVADVKEDHIIIDANHPLAGQDLIFELELIEIKS
jgi:FKBP-type peptidyl-prolyl cis-trans isomerase 2